MAYLGRQPIVGNYQVLDALTATTTDTYALTKNSVAVFPQTPANCIVSLNGVIQAPYDSYTISGSNIVFASALTASDSIDFITVLGDVLNVGTVSDGTIGLAKLSATGTKDATTFLRGDNTFASAGITEADQWRITANYTKTGVGTAILTSNWERNDNGFSLIGTGMTESSGIFSFPTTGIYMIIGQAIIVADGGTRGYMVLNIQKTTDNSTYDTISYSSQNAFTSTAYGSPCCTGIFDVTNISTHKIRMQINVESSVIVEGNTNSQSTGFTVIKLGDT